MKKRHSEYIDRRSFMSDLDPDLKELFAEETGMKRRTKTKKKKAKFVIGQSVESSSTFGTIIFGPYEDAFNNEVYEIETEAGQIITMAESSIAEYVPPIEEPDDDDGSL